MSDNPYHWRDFAADERKADAIRTLLGKPNLEFEGVILERVAVINEPPTAEILTALKDRLKCEVSTDPLQRTVITFKKSKHMADDVLKVLSALRYALVIASVGCFVAMIRSASRSEFFSSF